MKTILFLMLGLLLLATACGTGEQKQPAEAQADANTVYVYYFHGKERCKTCNAVEQVAKKTVNDYFASNARVLFVVVPNYEKTSQALVERYQISWNGLVVAKGDASVNLTEQAFANAVDTPEVLAELLKSKINNWL